MHDGGNEVEHKQSKLGDIRIQRLIFFLTMNPKIPSNMKNGLKTYQNR